MTIVIFFIMVIRFPVTNPFHSWGYTVFNERAENSPLDDIVVDMVGPV